MEFIETKNTLDLKINGKFRLNTGFKDQRAIFLLEDTVVKVDPLTPKTHCARQSAREIDFWETLQEDKEFFAELLSYGRTPMGRWFVVQKRYTPDSEILPETLTLAEDLAFKYNIHDLWSCYDESGNWLQSNGELKIYDWGV